MILATILTIIFGYLFTQVAGFVIHLFLHHPFTRRLHDSHRNHHDVQYPTHDFLSEKYKNPLIKDNPIIYYAVPAVMIAALAIFILPLALGIIFSVELLMIAVINDLMHSYLHIKGHWLERFEWFRRLRRLHYQHHLDDHTNFGIFFWFTDHLFGTFEEYVEVPLYESDESVSKQV